MYQPVIVCMSPAKNILATYPSQALKLFLVWDSEGIQESEDRVLEQIFESVDKDSDDEDSDDKGKISKDGKKTNKDDRKKKKKKRDNSSATGKSSGSSSSSGEANGLLYAWCILDHISIIFN